MPGGATLAMARARRRTACTCSSSRSRTVANARWPRRLRTIAEPDTSSPSSSGVRPACWSGPPAVESPSTPCRRSARSNCERCRAPERQADHRAPRSYRPKLADVRDARAVPEVTSSPEATRFPRAAGARGSKARLRELGDALRARPPGGGRGRLAPRAPTSAAAPARGRGVLAGRSRGAPLEVTRAEALPPRAVARRARVRRGDPAARSRTCARSRSPSS